MKRENLTLTLAGAALIAAIASFLLPQFLMAIAIITVALVAGVAASLALDYAKTRTEQTTHQVSTR